MRLRKILVVEDSELLQKMYNLVFRPFREEGTQILHAMDGRQGLEALATHPDVDLVVLDINMPVMSGLEFLREMKRHAPLFGIPVIIASTEGKEEDTIRGLRAGARGYVVKPFHPDDMLALIDRVLKPGVRAGQSMVVPTSTSRRLAPSTR